MSASTDLDAKHDLGAKRKHHKLSFEHALKSVACLEYRRIPFFKLSYKLLYDFY